ncbi:DegT/DnrJ/EryC1/StrS family aminotransferase [Pandoraea communis]|uniref:DegT/DnrJ/EryC1/StrS family aminotransferase n=1 Tax=Pandoraea communis TaxID=2508297 RepID=UPI0025A58095|nr:DegT/DnrJ/EryC1/StrS family aminotransferase [Pandoraea communis]MDM8355008.1 DegT/DnrJ/EryC1/StrS family aminotransferase [Pandoraea communis]
MTTQASIRLFQAILTPKMEQAALSVLRSGQIASGPKVPEFEGAFGELIGRSNVVCTSDMTSALVLALHLAGVGPGDEVVTLAFSCLASNSPIRVVGATAVWVDMDPMTASVNLDDFVRVLTSKTKAVTLYHVAGYPGPTKAIADICRERGIVLIEDCNNALGAQQDGRPVGAIGDYAVYSFYPNRQINALEGGALVCPDAASADRARALRRFGVDARTFRDSLGEINQASDVPEIGWSASFSQMNAAVGLANLPDVMIRAERTRANATYLAMACGDIPGIRAVTPLRDAQPVYWGLLLLAEHRDEVLVALKAAGVQASRMHYRNDGYSGFASQRRALPGTDIFMRDVIALPCGWWLDQAQLDSLVATLRRICTK